MRDLIDLHVHSTCSDGTFTPTELVVMAHRKKMKAFALTDHDTTAGIGEAIATANLMEPTIEVIPGIELSTAYKGKDIHIIGLGIDYKDIYFQTELVNIQVARDNRNAKIIMNLQQRGIIIDLTSMHDFFGDTILTRAHFARYLLNKGYVSNINDAFAKYIGDNAPCFVPKEEVTPYQAIQLIHKSGGKAILAHPLLYHFTHEELRILLSTLKKSGLDGIEVLYSMNRHGDEQRMKQLAKEFDLKISGGSDFHGRNKPGINLGTGKGNINISYDIWKRLKEDL